MKTKNRLAQVLHKLTEGRRKQLAIGRTFKFASGRSYRVQETGQLIRVSPLRPWRGKAERREVLRNRREDRAQRDANLTVATAAAA
jgi:hypothetical protein